MTYLKFAGPVIDETMAEAVKETLLSHWLTSGPRVAEFEKALSDYHGGRPTRVFTSATGAMEVAFQICGIGPGDEVITSAMTFFSVGNMIEKVGATTVFVDCDLKTRNINLDQVERAITPRTKAIVPTHFSGLPCDMQRLYTLAQSRGIRVIEDAALAIGSRWKGAPIGAFGDIATFSFHPNKNMTTIEGGACMFADEAEARRAEVLRFHGISRLPDGTRDVEVAGGKFNMSDVSAQLGLHQLKHLDDWCAHRQKLAAHYFAKLEPIAAELGIDLPARAYPGEESGHSWNMFCILLPLSQMNISRKQFIEAMHAEQIGIGVSYEAMHLTTLFKNKGHREGEFPNAERISHETVTLPLHAGVTVADVDRVCLTMANILHRHTKIRTAVA
jgi:dTDP-4-amino-4,6-dideoxygalactose transaminase